MRVLGIETSATTGGFAVIDGERLMAELVADITGRHVEKGVAMIGEVLDSAGVKVEDLDAVAVSLGPGSFTGLRVGLAIAKGMCFGRGMSIVGVPTLDCIAESLGSREGLVVPVRDARRGEIYFSIFSAEKGTVTRTCDYLAMPPDRVISAINDLPAGRSVVLSGDALSRYGDDLRAGVGSEVVFAPETMWAAKPSVVALMGASLIERGESADLDTIEPMYVRPSEAERQAAKPVDDGVT
ncbi:MAG: tRNA (adenosine(37)-N6)-threonylcarbamoyltransferase complex dimerization subunit type 1 TsaB [Candidatus Eisenbacteria bacterium]